MLQALFKKGSLGKTKDSSEIKIRTLKEILLSDTTATAKNEHTLITNHNTASHKNPIYLTSFYSRHHVQLSAKKPHKI